MAKSRRILPGFGLSLGYTVVYLSILVLIPFSAASQDIYRRLGTFL
jgi:sulfate/thiosulfate transport system permease protein